MSLKPTFPYQPLLLKILHNLQGLFVILAVITAIWTYNTYDGRWGKIFFLPDWQEIEGIHGTFGLYSLLIFPFFVIYVFHRGGKKLFQKNSFHQLKLVNKPIWWFTLHRLINILSIFALTFAVFTGKMMGEKWLPKGELNHFWYYLHLLSLIIIVFMTALHILMSVKIGGYPLILSMIVKYGARDKNSLKLIITSWRLKHSASHNRSDFFSIEAIKTWQKKGQQLVKQEWQQLPHHFQILEGIILLIIISAWVISILK